MEIRHSLLKKLSVFVTASTLLFTFSANALATQNQVENVGKLLLKSSAARKIDASDNKEAKVIYQQAKDYYQQAKESTEPTETKRLLDLVVMSMIKAGKIADKGAAVNDKHKVDFENRLKSVNALFTAQKTVADEKGNDKVSHFRTKVKELVSKAQGQYDKHDYVQGRDTLNLAYVLLKTSIEQMRDGDTLVHTLVFDTPADEFKYYQTKTDSQLTALNMFKERTNKASKQRMIENITKTANKYIKDATMLANDGDYEAAIPLMDKALTRLQSGLMMALN
jgi:hypothetical protein